MDELLWTFETLKGFVSHPIRAVRHWAVERLAKLFPSEAPAAVVPLLDDEDSYLVFRAAGIIGESGEGDRLGPTLLVRLSAAKGERFGRLVVALAQLNPDAARPILVSRAPRVRGRVNADEFLYVVEALGHASGDEARQALWELLKSFTADGFGVSAVVSSLLRLARPEDILPLTRQLRAWPAPKKSHWRTSLGALASAAGAGRLAEEMLAEVDAGWTAMLDRAEAWLGQGPPLAQTGIRALAAAYRKKDVGFFRLQLDEARRLFKARGDDVPGWRAAWQAGEPLTGYRRQAALVELILEAWAGPLSPGKARLRAESVVGLALLFELSVDRDDQAVLDAAPDKASALLSILKENRENVLPDVEDRVAALGPPIVPRLTGLLDPVNSEWGTIRAAGALEKIARRHPECCAGAIPVLLTLVNDQGGDYLLEACSDALSAIGPAVVEPIAQRLEGNRDVTREIYLTGVLGEVPTERSAQVLIERLRLEAAEDESLIEMYASALDEVGSPTAIPELDALWEPGDATMAESLLVLCTVNGVEHSRLAEWRRLVEAEDARQAKLTRSMGIESGGTDDPLATLLTQLLPSPPRPAPPDPWEDLPKGPQPEKPKPIPPPTAQKPKRHRKKR